jgi:hypothetical protein
MFPLDISQGTTVSWLLFARSDPVRKWRLLLVGTNFDFLTAVLLYIERHLHTHTPKKFEPEMRYENVIVRNSDSTIYVALILILSHTLSHVLSF